MLVSEFMTRNPVTVPPDATLAEAVRLLVSKRIRRLLVVQGGSVVGMLTQSDVLRAAPRDINPFSAPALDLPALAVPVRGFMASPVTSIAADAPLERAAQIFVDKKIGALPVLSGAALVGILTESDAFRALIALLGTGPGVRITFDVPKAGEDVLALVLDLSRRHHLQVASVLSRELDGRRLVLVRLLGPESPGLLDEIWKTGHRVLSVARL